jgi:hypothetical protein
MDDGSQYNYQRSFIKNCILLSNVNQPAVQPPSAPVSRQDIAYDKLLDLSYSGKMMQVVLNNGSAYVGTLGVVDANVLHINVDGTEIPFSRGVILRISVIEPPAPKAPETHGASSDAPAPW